MSDTPKMDNVGSAIVWILLGVTGGLGLDLCAKELLETYSLQEFVLVRSSIGAAIFILLARPLFGGLKSLRTKRWRWHLVRTMFAIGAMYGFFYGLTKMPLVNALALGFTAPLMITALSAVFLGDTIGWHRWGAVVVGFIGTLIILRPGAGEMSFASIAVLIAAFCYACQHITSRHLASESLLSLSLYVVVGPMLLSATLLDADTWITPDTKGWILMFGAGACSVIAWIGFVKGYQRSSPAILAPFEYAALVGGALAGYLIWDEVPDVWVLFGASIIVASGLYVVYREFGQTAAE